MDWKLELVVIPVSDVDRAKAFYTEKAGFHLDHDHRVSEEIRFVQLTPPGSACSIAIGKGLMNAQQDYERALKPGNLTVTPSGEVEVIDTNEGIIDSRPGSVGGLQLVVADIHAARAELAERGVEVSEVQAFPWGSFVFFADPDGNRWSVQQLPPRG
jgi:catechol 2,3-dioxygenase-like lactoylglutathione lyase family enzyme